MRLARDVVCTTSRCCKSQKMRAVSSSRQQLLRYVANISFESNKGLRKAIDGRASLMRILLLKWFSLFIAAKQKKPLKKNCLMPQSVALVAFSVILFVCFGGKGKNPEPSHLVAVRQQFSNLPTIWVCDTQSPFLLRGRLFSDSFWIRRPSEERLPRPRQDTDSIKRVVQCLIVFDEIRKKTSHHRRARELKMTLANGNRPYIDKSREREPSLLVRKAGQSPFQTTWYPDVGALQVPSSWTSVHWKSTRYILTKNWKEKKKRWTILFLLLVFKAYGCSVIKLAALVRGISRVYWHCTR